MEEAKEFLIENAGRWCHPSEKYRTGTVEYNCLMRNLGRYVGKMLRFGIDVIDKRVEKTNGKLYLRVKKDDVGRLL